MISEFHAGQSFLSNKSLHSPRVAQFGIDATDNRQTTSLGMILIIGFYHGAFRRATALLAWSLPILIAYGSPRSCFNKRLWRL